MSVYRVVLLLECFETLEAVESWDWFNAVNWEAAPAEDIDVTVESVQWVNR